MVIFQASSFFPFLWMSVMRGNWGKNLACCKNNQLIIYFAWKYIMQFDIWKVLGDTLNFLSLQKSRMVFIDFSVMLKSGIIKL